MKSMDTNILLYALNRDCAEHAACLALVRHALDEPEAWIVADQVWFELYRLLRNGSVLKHPLTAAEAAAAVRWYRDRSGWLHCAWETGMMRQLGDLWGATPFPARRTFDAVLAVTLAHNGVREFYTRNTKDFEGYSAFRAISPL